MLLIKVSFVSSQLSRVARGSNQAIATGVRSANQQTKVFDEINGFTLQ
ncbi:hypothetical protein NG796_19140 [Laspinema sp. A4]|nr:hypothetical protein [Laspinema sp. D2d]MCT7985393.1 hypothetical protein [Laspinema sp. D2d]